MLLILLFYIMFNNKFNFIFLFIIEKFRKSILNLLIILFILKF